MAQYRIRSIEHEDLGALAELYMSAYAGEPWLETWLYHNARERITEILTTPKSICYLYEENSMIIGGLFCITMSWHTGFQLEIKEIFVDPNHQRNGVAKKLINFVEFWAKDAGVTEIFFWTMRNRNSLKPDGLYNYYKKLGFEPSNNRIIMVKEL